MNVKIYLLDISGQLQSPVDEYLKYFSDERVERILRYKFNADRNRTVWAELLARNLIAERTGKNINEVKISREASGRPSCNIEGIFFSLSHAGGWVACSIGDSPNGIDVEITNRRINPAIAKRFFLASEYERLNSLDGDERTRKFFEYWTLKESCLKCLGLSEWSGVDCERLLSGKGELAGKNFYLRDAVVGLTYKKIPDIAPGSFCR